MTPDEIQQMKNSPDPVQRPEERMKCLILLVAVLTVSKVQSIVVVGKYSVFPVKRLGGAVVTRSPLLLQSGFDSGPHVG